MPKASFVLPSPSEKTPKSGAEDSHERHGSSVVGVNMDKCDPGEIKKLKKNCWSDPVMEGSQGNWQQTCRRCIYESRVGRN